MVALTGLVVPTESIGLHLFFSFALGYNYRVFPIQLGDDESEC